MNKLSVGDYAYMVDIVFRHCVVVDNPVTLNKDLMPINSEENHESYRVIASKPEAIDLMIEKLKEIREQENAS